MAEQESFKDRWQKAQGVFKERREAQKQDEAVRAEARAVKADDTATKTLAKVGLDLDNASPADIKQHNAASVRKIRSDMAGNGLIKAGAAFGGSATERAALDYYSALVEQNWILIRQNELIIRYLEQGKEK